MLPDRRSRRAVCRAFVPAKNGGTITWRGGHAGQANEPSRRSSAMNPRARRRVACLGPRSSNMRGGRDCESECMFTSAASSTAETAASAPVIATTAAPSTRCRRRRPALEIANKAGPLPAGEERRRCAGGVERSELRVVGRSPNLSLYVIQTSHAYRTTMASPSRAGHPILPDQVATGSMHDVRIPRPQTSDSWPIPSIA